MESTYLCIWALHGYLAARMKTGWPKSIIPSTHIDVVAPLRGWLAVWLDFHLLL